MLSPFIETIQCLSVIFKNYGHINSTKRTEMCLVDYFFVVTVLLICNSHENIGGLVTNADKSNL